MGLAGGVAGFCEAGFDAGEAGAACPKLMVVAANRRRTERPFFTRTSFQETVICSGERQNPSTNDGFSRKQRAMASTMCVQSHETGLSSSETIVPS